MKKSEKTIADLPQNQTIHPIVIMIELNVLKILKLIEHSDNLANQNNLKILLDLRNNKEHLDYLFEIFLELNDLASICNCCIDANFLNYTVHTINQRSVNNLKIIQKKCNTWNVCQSAAYCYIQKVIDIWQGRIDQNITDNAGGV